MFICLFIHLCCVLCNLRQPKVLRFAITIVRGHKARGSLCSCPSHARRIVGRRGIDTVASNPPVHFPLLERRQKGVAIGRVHVSHADSKAHHLPLSLRFLRSPSHVASQQGCKSASEHQPIRKHTRVATRLHRNRSSKSLGIGGRVLS